MGNTSKKYRNKKLANIGIAAIIIILVVSFFVSQSSKTVDPSTFADVEVQAIEPRLRGNEASEIVLTKYSDFQCPACAQASVAIKSLNEQFGDQFVLEYKHLPLRSIHPNAQIAAQASEAAGMQGKFWEMHDLLFEKQSEWSRALNPKKVFNEYAVELGLNPDRFDFDLDSEEVKEKVNSDAEEAQALGFSGTPSFTVNGEVSSFDEFFGMLDVEVVEE